MTPWPIDCLLIGDVSLLQRCGQALLDAGARIRLVVTDDDGIAAWAAGAGLPCAAFGAADPVAIGAGAVDVVFSIGNLRVLPPAWLAVARDVVVNFHDGPLPAWKGLNVPAFALMAGAREHGISWHVATAEVDGGDLLEEERFALAADDTALTVNARCFDAGLRAFDRLIAAWREGRVRRRPQGAGPSRVVRRHDRPAAAGHVDPSAGLDACDALVRALDFGPYDNPLGTPWAWDGGRRVAVTAHTIGEWRAGRGPRVAPFDPALAVRLGERHAAWCIHEPHWVGALASLDPIDITVGRPAAAPERRVEVRPAPSFAGRGATNLGTAVLVWLSRVFDRRTADVGCRTAVLDQAVAGLEPWLDPLPPLRVEVDPSARYVDAARRVDAALAQHERLGSFLVDLPARYRALKGVTGGRWTAGVAVTIGATRATGADATAALLIAVDPDASSVSWSYDTAAIAPALVDALARSCAVFLAAAAAAPETALVALPLVDVPEARRLEALNATDAPISGAATIVGQFAAQAAATPAVTAVVDGRGGVSYRDLDARSTAVAAALRARGIGAGDIVGLHVDRSTWMVAAVLGVMKAGAAYLPLDPAYPPDRTAFIVEDAGARLIVTSRARAPQLPAARAALVLDDLADAPTSAEPVPFPPAPDDVAYVIYTSGSTGRPKGVLLEHRQVVSFFAGMDRCVRHDSGGVWLAVTSLSFDISVLELLWTTCRGFTVVVHDAARAMAAGATAAESAAAPIDLSLFYFSADERADAGDRYRLLLDGARIADAHGFQAVWTPERHFHAFGGLYPNPAVTGAAVAAITSRVKIRAGSLVLPLHHPVRATEDWSLVDNLSGGRVGIAFASGWHPDDFVLAPGNFPRAKQVLVDGLDTMRRLWRGEAVSLPGPSGDDVTVRTFPRPVQPELPYWITTAGNPDTFRQAGALGANVLTHLLGQSIEEVRDKIAVYRDARRAAGHHGRGHVTLMLHTFVGESDEAVRRLVRAPMKRYLGTSLNLVQKHAWSFPAFKGRAVAPGTDTAALFADLPPDQLDALLEHAFERYFESGGLFGSVETCAATIERVRAIGVDEVACLIDFGVPTDAALAALAPLARVREAAVAWTPSAVPPMTLAGAIEHFGVTHLQCTPSLAALLVDDAASAGALARLQHWLIGGEALSETLAARVTRATRGRVTNMYGPTETTVWSLTHDLAPGEMSVPIGQPIANTRLQVLDSAGVAVVPGLPGELWIGGPGVARGYHRRPELTGERFVADRTGSAARRYRTGDRVRLRPDGRVEFLGRMDGQVKVRGHRIELGEIEAALRAVAGVREAVAVAREVADGDVRLVAYVTRDGAAGDLMERCRAAARAWLPDVMVPIVVPIEALPRTPNGKLDRRRLPAVASATGPTGDAIADGTSQRLVADVWASVLHAGQVGLDDNFFDLGGHSLLTVQVAAQLTERLGRAVALTDLFRFATVRTLAAHLDAAAGSGPEEVTAGAGAGRARAAARRAARHVR